MYVPTACTPSVAYIITQRPNATIKDERTVMGGHNSDSQIKSVRMEQLNLLYTGTVVDLVTLLT